MLLIILPLPNIKARMCSCLPSCIYRENCIYQGRTRAFVKGGGTFCAPLDNIMFKENRIYILFSLLKTPFLKKCEYLLGFPRNG